MRRKLTIATFAAAGLLLGWVALSVKESRQLRLSFGSPAQQQARQPQGSVLQNISATAVVDVTATSVLTNARYTGRDVAGRVWEITADSATQSASASETTLVLANARAFLQDTSRSISISFTAPVGTFASQAQLLELSGGVKGQLNP